MVRHAELCLSQQDKQTRMRTARLSADDQPEKIEMNMFEKIQNPREIRLRLNLNQQEFWGQIGVTQSGGSRYESGRNMPKPVRELLRLVHVDQIDLKKINRGDVALISYLKSAQPALYRRLKTEAGTRSRRRR